jgi:hypothetical protein
MGRYTEPTRWGREIEDVLRWHRAQVAVDLTDLARAAAREFTEGWESDDWRAAKRGLSARQREMLRELADELAREWYWPQGGDVPADVRAYARELRRTIPREVRAMARAWRPAPREWPPRPLAAF